MSPILVRPIREQSEHNRVIRLLVARFRRKFAVGVNIGDEPEATGARSGTHLVYPDLVLTSTEGVRRVHGVVEVETAESVNHLEAMAEWASFGRVRGAFYLYVPAGSTDVARRLCEESHVSFTEIWGYLAVGDQMRFTMAHRSARATAAGKRATRVAKEAPRATPASGGKTTPAAKPTRPVAKSGRTKTATKAGAATSVTRKKATTTPAAKPAAAKVAGPVKKASGLRAAKKTAKSVKSAAKPARTGTQKKKKTTAAARPRKRR